MDDINTLQKQITKKTYIREKAESQIYTLIVIKTRIEITPSSPAKCCKHLTNQRKSPNFRRGSPRPAKRFLKFNWAATLTFDSIFYSGAITCFVYPSANRTLLLQERTGHLGAQPVESHRNPNCFSSSLFFCFDCHFEFSRGLPLNTCFQTPVPRSRYK